MNASEREATFRRWTSDHLGLLLKVVRAYAADRADQDDLFQDILVQIWLSIPAFRSGSTGCRYNSQFAARRDPN